MKDLHVTVDFTDDLVNFGQLYEPAHVDQLFDYFGRLGICRVDWHWDTWIDTYLMPFGGCSNLMAYAVQAGHDRSIEVHAVVKPFEMGPAVWSVPHTFPRPSGLPLFDTHKGLIVTVDPFLLTHPEMQFRRMPAGQDDEGPVRSVRLVKSDDEPTTIELDDLRVLVGPGVGNLRPYSGQIQFSDEVEWRSDFPTGGPRRVLTLDGLTVDPPDRFIVIACEAKEGTFTNTLDNLIELCDERGNRLPSTPASLKIDWTRAQSRPPIPELTAYGRTPAVIDFLNDQDRLKQACETAYLFDETVGSGDRTLDVAGGFAGAMRGKSEYLTGTLSPVYPEVQDRWLEMIGDCLAAGVDGVNIRAAGHSSHVHDRDEYGFIEDAMIDGHVDRDLAARANGDAYTEFLRKAKRDISSAGKVTSLHINATFDFEDDRHISCNLPPNVAWQWETWIRDIADVVHLKDMHFLREPRARHFVDRATRVAKETDRPVVYIGTNKELRFSGEHDRTRFEMGLAMQHPRIDAFQLYEAASFTRVDERGMVVGSEEIADLIAKEWS
jgi:hypothetical protein